MHTYYHDAELPYDGSQLASLFAYKRFGLQGDSITAFCGSCDIPWQHMVDQEDVLEASPIYSDSMLHFILEHFETPLTLMVTRQRLLVMLAKEQLETLSRRALGRRGDDLFFEGRKLSISIATVSPVSGLVHFALNLNTQRVPVPAASLAELGVAEPDRFAESLMSAYRDEVDSIRLATCKVKGVE